MRAGRVRVDGRMLAKPAAKVTDASTLEVDDPLTGYVGRGAGKLLAALDGFGLHPGGVALDAGACTGGFTQVLLERGARLVYALDVGHKQLAPELRADPRVIDLSGTNIRSFAGAPPDWQAGFVVADLSFVSLTLALPGLSACAAPNAQAVLLVKPQFEAGRAALDGLGVVRDPHARAAAVQRVAEAGALLGWRTVGVMPSPITGGSGNREFLLWLRRGDSDPSVPDLTGAVQQDGIVLFTDPAGSPG